MTDLPHDRVRGKHGRAGFELHPEVLNSKEDVLLFLRTRRSCPAADIGPPGPDDALLERLMEAATRVPDHGKLTPWRFIIFRGQAREDFAQALRKLRPELAGEVSEAALWRQVPLVVAVISSPVDHPRIPLWEQQLSAGAVCLALLNAALASGLAAQWRTGWPAFDADVAKLLGLKPQEQVAGFIHIGTRRADAAPLTDRRRPFWRDLATFPENDGGADA